MSDAQFLRNVGDTPALLIEVAEDRDLLRGLETASTAVGTTLVAHRDKIGFRTAVKDSAPAMIQRALDRRHMFERKITESAHFIAPLRKREGIDRPFSEHILVGRAFSSDLVLRHDSVSKLHAWFEKDANGTYCVTDSGSRNGTTINGEALAKREPFPIQDGDIVVFGDVSCFFCRPPRLRGLVRGERISTRIAR